MFDQPRLPNRPRRPPYNKGIPPAKERYIREHRKVDSDFEAKCSARVGDRECDECLFPFNSLLRAGPYAAVIELRMSSTT